MRDLDASVLRNRMVEEQLLPRGIFDARVLNAFRKVPRHAFVPDKSLENAYGDFPLQVGEGQTISQPYMVALMTQYLDLKADDKVLEIGTGSGYQTSILAELAKEVYSVERLAVLAESAQAVLNSLGYINIKIKLGDGTEGWEKQAPYDAIIVTAGAPAVPEPLVEQLAEGGRLVIPVGTDYQELKRLKKIKGEIVSQTIIPVRFVPMLKGGESKKR